MKPFTPRTGTLQRPTPHGRPSPQRQAGQRFRLHRLALVAALMVAAPQAHPADYYWGPYGDSVNWNYQYWARYLNWMLARKYIGISPEFAIALPGPQDVVHFSAALGYAVVDTRLDRDYSVLGLDTVEIYCRATCPVYTSVSISDYTLTTGFIQTTSPGELNLYSNIDTLAGTLAYTVRDNSQVNQYSRLAGSFGVEKNGAGTLMLAADNNSPGLYSVNGGTLQIGNGSTGGSIVGNVVNNAVLSFNRSDDISFASVISGGGSVTKLNANTLTLTGANTYWGGTDIAAGTLQIGNGGTAGSIVGPIGGSGNLTFNRSDDFNPTSSLDVYDPASRIAIGGTLTKLGAGKMTLVTQTIAGSFTVAAGTLLLDNLNAAGFSSLQVDAGATLALSSASVTGEVNNNFRSIDVQFLANQKAYAAGSTFAIDTTNGDFTLDKPFSGVYTFEKQGTNTLTVTSSLSPAGGTRISGGVLQLGNGGSTGSIAGTIVNNASLVLNRTGTVSNLITGTGSVTKANAADLTLTGNNTYTGGTTIAVGTLSVGSGATGSITGDVFLNGAGTKLIFNRSTASTFDGNTYGNGSIRKAGGGTLTLTGNFNHTGGTVISSGTLQIGNGGTAGWVSGDIVNNTNLAFKRSDDVSFAGIVSGGGTLTQAGAGLLTLAGANTYSGNTNVLAGTFKALRPDYLPGLGTQGKVAVAGGATFAVDVGGASAWGAADLDALNSNASFAAGATLALDTSAGSFSYGGSLSGNLGLNKTGANTLRLTGARSYTGKTTVSAGTLAVDRPIELQGLGTPGQVAVLAGSTLALQAGGAGQWTAADIGTLNDNSAFAAGSTLAIDTGAGSFSYDHALGGALSLDKRGSNTLTVSGNLAHSGGTTVSGGTLQVGNGGTGGTIAGNIVNAAALVFNRSDSSSFAGDLSGAGTLTKRGAGTLSLTGNATHTGGTALTAGTLQIGNGGTGGSIAGDIANNATLAFNRADDVGYAGTLSGTGSLTKLGAGTLIATGDLGHTGGTAILAGTLQIGNGGSSGSLTGPVVDQGSLVFNRADTVSFAGAISGSGSVVQAGSGTLVLTGANSYTGSTTVAAGTLVADTPGRLPNYSLPGKVQVNSGATLSIGYGGVAGWTVANIDALATGASFAPGSRLAIDTTAGNLSYDRHLTGDMTLAKVGANTLTVTGNLALAGGMSVAGGVLQIGNGGTAGSLVGNIENNGSVVFNRSDDVTYAGVISGIGSLTKLGTGTLRLTGTNTFDGKTRVAAGTLWLDTPITLWLPPIEFTGGSRLRVEAGATLKLLFDRNVGWNSFPFAAVQPRVAYDAGSTLEIDTPRDFQYGDNLTISCLCGDYRLAKSGAGTLFVYNPVVAKGGVVVSEGSLWFGWKTSTYWNTVVRSDIVNNANVTFQRFDDVNYGNVLSGTGTFNKRGQGVLTLYGVNTYTGATMVDKGILRAGAAAGGQAFGNGSAVVMASVVSPEPLDSYYVQRATLDLNGFNQTIGSLAGGSSTLGNVTLGTATLTVGNATSTVYAGEISGSGSIVKQGTGQLTLAGVNTYTGSTSVTGGTLAVNGALADTAVTIGSGAKLQGSGRVAGTVTVQAGGTLAAGNSIESLATGSLSLGSGSTFAYEMDKGAAPGLAGDLTAVTGDLTLAADNTSVLTLAELGKGSWAAGAKLTLIGYSGSWNGALFTYLGKTVANDGRLDFGGTGWTLKYNDTVAGTNFAADLTGKSYVTISAVPEPSVSMLLAAGVALLGLRGARRSMRSARNA